MVERYAGLVDFAALDLQRLYRSYNDRYFGGALPDVRVGLRKLKGVSGVTKARVKFSGGVPEILELSVTISSLVSYDEADFPAVLLHEMVHVWCIVRGHVRDNHGPFFRSKAAEVSRASGHRISLTHDIAGPTEVAGEPRIVGVLLVPADALNPAKYQLFDPAAYSAFRAKADYVAELFQRPVELHLVPTMAWAHAVVKRRPERSGITLNPLHGQVAQHLDLSKGVLRAVVQPPPRTTVAISLARVGALAALAEG